MTHVKHHSRVSPPMAQRLESLTQVAKTAKLVTGLVNAQAAWPQVVGLSAYYAKKLAAQVEAVLSAFQGGPVNSKDLRAAQHAVDVAGHAAFAAQHAARAAQLKKVEDAGGMVYQPEPWENGADAALALLKKVHTQNRPGALEWNQRVIVIEPHHTVKDVEGLLANGRWVVNGAGELAGGLALLDGAVKKNTQDAAYRHAVALPPRNEAQLTQFAQTRFQGGGSHHFFRFLIDSVQHPAEIRLVANMFIKAEIHACKEKGMTPREALEAALMKVGDFEGAHRTQAAWKHTTKALYKKYGILPEAS